METDQRKKEEPSTSSAAWDVAANYVQKCTGCFAIAVLLKQSNCLLFISPETSEKLFSVINCNFHRTTCKWFLIFSQQQLKDFYFWCYKDSSGIYKTIYSASSQDKCKNSHHLSYCMHYLGRCSKYCRCRQYSCWEWNDRSTKDSWTWTYQLSALADF